MFEGLHPCVFAPPKRNPTIPWNTPKQHVFRLQAASSWTPTAGSPFWYTYPCPIKPLTKKTFMSPGSQFLDPDGWFPNHVPNPEDKAAMTAGVRAVNKCAHTAAWFFFSCH